MAGSRSGKEIGLDVIFAGQESEADRMTRLQGVESHARALCEIGAKCCMALTVEAIESDRSYVTVECTSPKCPDPQQVVEVAINKVLSEDERLLVAQTPAY